MVPSDLKVLWIIFRHLKPRVRFLAFSSVFPVEVGIKGNAIGKTTHAPRQGERGPTSWLLRADRNPECSERRYASLRCINRLWMPTSPVHLFCIIIPYISHLPRHISSTLLGHIESSFSSPFLILPCRAFPFLCIRSVSSRA